MSKTEQIWNIINDYYLDENVGPRFPFGLMTSDITILSVDNYYLVIAYTGAQLSKLTFKISKDYNLVKGICTYTISDVEQGSNRIVASDDDVSQFIYDNMIDIFRDRKIKTILD